MLESTPTTVTGVFTDPTQAERTREELVRAGFRPEQIEITKGLEGAIPAPVASPRHLRATDTAVFGALLGGAIGCLMGALLGPGAALGGLTAVGASGIG